MKKLMVPFFVSWWLLSSAAWAGDLQTEIMDAEARFQTAYNEKNASGAANSFTEDGVRLPAEGPRIEGRRAIYEMIQGELELGFTNLRLEVRDVEGADDIAWAIGRYMLDMPQGDNEMRTLTGRYLVIYERSDDGVWRIRVDTWSN